ncbi:MAG: hypothetical protein KIT89_02690 [Microcella sp.]|uniref:hypothetical protein n=1 Tax=Microcella sp. TaxID=1913979 RepID=UPI0024CA2B48|nr:hypothetical protein [Microcella sp.]UYN84140.1 MAG: hypothetical protein KIT89_02690 [Microcella sp.]
MAERVSEHDRLDDHGGMPHAVSSIDASSAVREVGGFRVVRVLAASPRAQTLVAHADGETVAVRVLHRETADAVIDAEVAISDAAKGAGGAIADHLSLVTDLATLADGRVALFSAHLAGPRLDSVLHAQAGLVTLGEAITVLAPLADALDSAHRLGITGLPLTADSVRLSAAGAPVLTRRHRARLGPVLPDRFRDHEPAYAADLDAFDALGATVAAATDVSQRPALQAALRHRGPALLHALFDLAEPHPLQVEREAEPASRPADEVTGVSVMVDRDLAAPPPAAPSTALPRRLEALVSAVESVGLPRDIATVVRGSAERLALGAGEVRSALTRRLRTGVTRVRPRFLLVGLAGAAALALAVVVLGQSTASVSERVEAGVAVDGTSAGLSEPSLPESALPESALPESALPETALHPDADEWAALVASLVDRWFACGPAEDTVDSGCVARVAHAGSAAERLIASSDPRHAALLQWQQSGGEVVVTERMGAAVLVDLITPDTTAASLLLVRSEAGWRIRDVVA